MKHTKFSFALKYPEIETQITALFLSRRWIHERRIETCVYRTLLKQLFHPVIFSLFHPEIEEQKSERFTWLINRKVSLSFIVTDITAKKKAE